MKKDKIIQEIIKIKKEIEKAKKEFKGKHLHTQLHKYNEIKDVGQYLLGFIAGKKNKSIKVLYEEMEITDDENN